MEVEILRKITQLPGLEQAESKAGRPLSAFCRLPLLSEPDVQN
jgi:hypothetical protein